MTSIVNRELLIDVLAHILLDPESWNQGTWAGVQNVDTPPDQKINPLAPACGTSFRFAGWTCIVNGDRFEWPSEIGGEGADISNVIAPGGEVFGIAYRAGEVLGLTGSQREALFAAGNDLDALFQFTARVLAGVTVYLDDNYDVDETELRGAVDARVLELQAERKKYLKQLRRKADKFAAKAEVAKQEADRLTELVRA